MSLTQSNIVEKASQIELELESIQRLNHERIQIERTKDLTVTLKDLDQKFNTLLSFKRKSHTLRSSIAVPNLNPEQEQIKNARLSSLKEGVVRIHDLTELKKECQKKLIEIRKASKEITSPTSHHQELSDVNKKIELIENYIKVTIETSNEAYYGYYLGVLKKYKRSSNLGKIVETKYVEDKEQEVLRALTNQSRILIHGPYGSGKTDMAIEATYKYHELLFGKNKKILPENSDINDPATELEGFEFVDPWSEGAYEESVFDINHTNQEIVVKKEDTLEKKLNKELQRRKLSSNLPYEILSGSGRTEDHHFEGKDKLDADGKGAMESNFNLGPLYRAMRDGKVLIIDEFNAIPPEVLFALNDILQRAKVGSVIEVKDNPGQQIIVKEGFGIIFTGNLPSETNGVVGRKVQDAAFLSRFEPVEYGFLPQSKENNITKVNPAKGGNEIFEVMMSKIIDRNGYTTLAPDAIGDVWKFAAFSSYIQDIYSGRNCDTVWIGGEDIAASEVIKGNSISWREIGRVFDKWIMSGCVEKIGSVIHKQLDIITDSTAKSALKQLLESKYGMSSKQASYDMQYAYQYTPREIIDIIFGKPDSRGKEYYHKFIETPKAVDAWDVTQIDIPIYSEPIEHNNNEGKDTEEVWREVYEVVKDIKEPVENDRNKVAQIIGCNPKQVSINQNEALTGNIVFHIGKIVLPNDPTITPASTSLNSEGQVTNSTQQSIIFPKMMSGKLMLPSLTKIDGLELPEILYDLDLRQINRDITQVDLSPLKKPIKIMKFLNN